MNTQRVNAILAQVLLSAEDIDPYTIPGMGPIHFIKYIYLTDLFHAEHNQGGSFTDTTWRFHHYGPWDVTLYDHLENGLYALGATKNTIPPQYGVDDCIRWIIGDREKTVECASQELCAEYAHYIDSQVKIFGNSTPKLLDYVYKTPPMLKAAPDELLSFEPTGFFIKKHSHITENTSNKRTDDEERKYQIWLADAQKFLAEKADEIRRNRQPPRPIPPPRYDKVFFDGMMAMDEPEIPMLPIGQYTVTIDDSIWKSKARNDCEIP